MVPTPTAEWQLPFDYWKMRGRYERIPLLVLSEEVFFSLTGIIITLLKGG